MSAAFASFVYRWRIPLAVAILVGAIALAPRANITDFDNDLTAWFSREDPAFQDYERFRKEFGGTRTLIVALEGERLFSREGLAFLRDVTGAIERVPTVERVYSLANANVVTAIPAGADEPGGIDVRPLLDRLGERDPAAIRRRALEDPLLRGDLISETGAVTAIVVSFDEDRIDEVRAGVIEEIHRVVDPRLPDGVRAYYNGSLEIGETYNRVTLQNQRTFIPPMLVIALVTIYATFRSIRRTLLTLFAVALSMLWTLGLYSLMGFTYNVLTSMIVPLVFVLAIADDVHIMQHYEYVLAQGADPERAFKSTVAYLLAPLLGASGTTALGMLSLATSDVVAVRTFGIGAAVGVMVDFVISIVFVPTCLGLLKPETGRSPHERYLLGPLRRVARFSTARPGFVAGVALALAVAAGAGAARLRVDTNHINFFSVNHPLHQSADVIDRQLSGVYSFQILLEGEPGVMIEPDTLRRMEDLERRLERLPFVRKVTSLADYVRRVNRELNDGDPAADAIPASRETIAQELFVFSLSDAGRSELERIVATDHSNAQISVKLASMSSDLVFEQIHEAERLAGAAFDGTGIRSTVTGVGRLSSTLDHYLVESQLTSFGTAFVTVFGVIFLVFRSARFGLLAIAPNLFPVLAVLGAMGWLGISLNVATVMLASVTLGVVDDDTIHFINRYRREMRLRLARGAGGERGPSRSAPPSARERGWGPASTEGSWLPSAVNEAIEAATIYEGRAALTTALINTCGFSVLMTSEYRPTAWFGGLLALTMGVAFLAEVFILPAIIKLVPGVFGAERVPAARPVLEA